MLDSNHINHFKNLFLELDRAADEELNEALNLDNQVSGDDVDRWSSEQNNSLQLKLIARTRLFKKKVTQSLERLEDGTFGECQDCGSKISLSRLMARPTAELCIHCKEEQEGDERRLRYEKRSHTLGRSLLVSGESSGFASFDDDNKVLNLKEIH
jgi:DnaK suppressor protein